MFKQINNDVSPQNSMSEQPEPSSKTIREHRNLAIPLIIILTITTLLYTRALQNGILSWDDHWHVTWNKDIQALSQDNIKAIFTSYYVNMYHPLVTLTFAIEYQLFGLNPVAYHATNVLFHLANIILVFFLVLRLSGRRETAIIAACLFGIHPMHVESVAWITERKDVCYAFFYLFALLFYIRFIQKEGKKYYWLAFLFFVLSLFSKVAAVTFPIILLLFDVYFHRKVRPITIIEKIPLFLLSIVFGYFGFHTQSESTGIAILQRFEYIDRFFLASYSICYYLIHLFVPINLSAVHFMPEKVHGFLPFEYYLSIIPLIVLVFIGTRKGVFQRELIFGLLFFITILSLNIQIVPFGMAIVSERYTYMPYVGLYYVIGQLYCFVADRTRNLLLTKKKVMFAIASLLVILLGYLTYQRIGVWKSTQILFHDATMKAGSYESS